MHSLVCKRLEMAPKEMEKEMDGNDIDGGTKYLFSTDLDCQPCNLFSNSTLHSGSCLSPDFHLHNPHSSNCSYGIQALFNDIHGGYTNDGEDDPDQCAITEELSQEQKFEILRRKKELELQVSQRESQAKQDRILKQGAMEREKFYRDREAQIEAKKRLNRENETKHYAAVKSQQKLVDGNLWEAVAALINLNDEVGRKTVNGSGKSVVELSTPKKPELKKPGDLPNLTKKSTDLSRMREILLKLQHQPLVR